MDSVSKNSNFEKVKECLINKKVGIFFFSKKCSFADEEIESLMLLLTELINNTTEMVEKRFLYSIYEEMLNREVLSKEDIINALYNVEKYYMGITNISIPENSTIVNSNSSSQKNSAFKKVTDKFRYSLEAETGVLKIYPQGEEQLKYYNKYKQDIHSQLEQEGYKLEVLLRSQVGVNDSIKATN